MKYLVRQIFEEVIEVINEVDVISKTKNVLEYKIKGTTDARHLPRGGDYIFIEGVETRYPKILTDDDGALSIIEDSNVADLKTAYKLMDDSVRLEAATKMQTTNKDSIFAFVDTFQLRIMLAERYVGIGLVAQLEVSGFTIGDALDDVVKIKAYYGQLLFDLDIHRLNKIGQYLETKSSLGFPV